MNAEALYDKGLDKINQNQFEEAIELFTQAIELEDDNPFFFNQRAVAYLNIGKYDLSLFDMNRSIELDDKYAYFYSCRGFLKAKMKDANGAIADYEQSLELDPDNAITYNNLALVLEQVGNINKAKRMHKKGDELVGYDAENRTFDAEKQHMVDKPEEEYIPKTKEETKSERKQLAKEVFKKKSTFKEFLGFIGNGFKLKRNDKSGEG